MSTVHEMGLNDMGAMVFWKFIIILNKIYIL